MQLAGLSTAGEFFGKATLLVIFGVFATLKTTTILRLLDSWRPDYGLDRYIEIAAQLAGLAFLVLVLGLTLLRYKPRATAEHWEPRFSALAGTFFALLLVVSPLADIGPAMRIVAIALILVGWLLSTYVLAWLGRSFSIQAQARQLVTAGPYAIVRHPLYVCEEIAMIGMVLLSLSPAAIAIAVVQWMFQLRRMTNEERVLGAAFPDYAAYAVRTPKIIPRLFG